MGDETGPKDISDLLETEGKAGTIVALCAGVFCAAVFDADAYLFVEAAVAPGIIAALLSNRRNEPLTILQRIKRYGIDIYFSASAYYVGAYLANKLF
ncbi:MAG: hypothetical protein KJ574_02040 [Nanoarchaeota archaeon]|nr:hypothetical protein [Nanoarchaeota archaeon]